MKRRYNKILVFIFLSAAAYPVYGRGAGADVAAANRAYAEGRLEEALALYERASVEAPEAPEIYFNKGAAHYKLEDYAKAAESFEKAAMKSKDAKFEARSRYNLGNCAFRESLRQADSDLKKSFEGCEKSIRCYREALELDPGLKEAAENIEVVRIRMKTILDELKKRQEEQQKQEEAAKQAAEKIKEMIRKQTELLEETQKVSGQEEEKIKDLAGRQNGLKDETRAFSAGISESKVKEKAEAAGMEQEASAKNLETKNPEASVFSQKNAVQKLEEALKELEDCGKNQGQGQEQQKQQEQQGGKQGREGQQGQEKKEEQEKKEGVQAGEEDGNKKDDSGEDKKENAVMSQVPDDAEDILKEEKENRQDRRPFRGGYAEVERDW